MKRVYTYRHIVMMVVVLLIPALSSCLSYRLQPEFIEERGFMQHEISQVAVLPFINRTSERTTLSETADVFSSELARFREVSVVHPMAVAQFLKDKNIQLSEAEIVSQACLIGEAFSVQAVIIGVITEADPYFPPTCGLSLMVVDVRSGETIITKSDVYDAHLLYVRDELKGYASTHATEDSLLHSDLLLHRFDLYIRFVCHQMIRKYL